MIVTIDGPAGTGKSTTARKLADRLGFTFLDTGAMYRAVTLAVVRQHRDPADADLWDRFLETLHLQFINHRLHLNDEDISRAIRQPEVTKVVSLVSKRADVREYLTRQQRSMVKGHQLVTEGRDQGTVVFPQAEVKIFLTADVQVRAKRRLLDYQATGNDHQLDDVLKELRTRDQTDSSRRIAPLVPADDAHIVDTSQMTIDQTVEHLEKLVQKARQQPTPASRS